MGWTPQWSVLSHNHADLEGGLNRMCVWPYTPQAPMVRSHHQFSLTSRVVVLPEGYPAFVDYLVFLSITVLIVCSTLTADAFTS